MTWSEFKSEVRALLPLDNRRVGAQGYIERTIVSTLTELQLYVTLIRPDPDGPVVREFFDSDEYALFNADTAEAVALKVKSDLARLGDHNLAEWQSYLASYTKKRTAIYIDASEREQYLRSVSMIARATEYEFFRGDTFSLTLNVKLKGQPVDLTGASLAFTAKRWCDLWETDDSKAVIKKTTAPDDGITITNAAKGIAVLRVPPSETTELDGVVYFDIQLTTANADVFTVERGKITIISDITKQ